MTSFRSDTIIAPATSIGAGAISIIRISGDAAFQVADALVAFKDGKCADFPGYSIHFGSILLEDGSPLDDVLVSVFRSPHSYTGENSVEISCHASSYVVQEVLRLGIEAGARLAEAGEFTKRAYMNGKMDLAQAESVADIISSEDSISHRVAFNQMRGGFSHELTVLKDRLQEMAALMELELDFSEEDVEFADRTNLIGLLDEVLGHIDSLASSFRVGNALKNGVPVVIAGAANTGKSTLLNALLGEDRAIVSDIAGTTRDTIEEVIRIGNVRYRFIDTAGIRTTDETIEKIGIERSVRKISEAEIVLAVVDASASEEEISRQLSEIVSYVSFERQKLAILVNKCDILGLNKNVSINNKFVTFADTQIVRFNISAKTSEGLDEVKNWLSSWEKDNINASSDAVLVTNMRHFEALSAARTPLLRARSGLTSSLPTDLVAQDLREAISDLDSILGTSAITADTTLSLIFSRFCIGK
ncbi:MAG: tRNA uridine-5-carboxymethylaminomethyl(34) synthesis GTPase MnmE [Bacteroidales bacterium]|nr:tRNA uridine-5-carboxymethylaminomethyl(34) synthesis GTPase MnmE [Bacteroidales bacterium]